VSRRRTNSFPFVLHQFLDYILGFWLLISGVRFPHSAAVTAISVGGALVLLAMLSEGVIGIGKVSRGSHATLDGVLVAILAAAPIALHFTRARAALVTFEGAAAVLLWLTATTNYANPKRRQPGVATRTALVETTPRVLGRAFGRINRG
jgi:hypothetical protein